MAHFSQIWLAKWQQRRQLMKSRDKQQETRDQQVISPGGPALTTSEKQGSSVHKALIWPQQQRQSASPVSIPVGVAVSQQCAGGKRSSPAKPEAPIQVDVQPAVPPFTNAQIPYAPPVKSPALYSNWPLWPPDYAGFWPGHGEALGYAGYTVPPQAPAAGVIHHRHVSGGGAGPPAASPFLLIPCLGKEESAGLEPKIATSKYAAALASAAGCLTSPANATPPAAPEKMKRKADCPVRNQDTEPTETIVSSKKRKFSVQLFRWHHSSSLFKLNFRSKLAELQSIYKEKQNIPKHFKHHSGPDHHLISR